MQRRNVAIGEIAGTDTMAFKSEMIDQFEKFPPVPDPIKTKIIYLSADPTGGGKSALSFFAMTQVDGLWVRNYVLTPGRFASLGYVTSFNPCTFGAVG